MSLYKANLDINVTNRCPGLHPSQSSRNGDDEIVSLWTALELLSGY